jgi:hypothetical protein
MFFGSKLEWIVLAVACVVALLLFPAPTQHAPFSAVYGPATDLRSSIDVTQAIPLLITAMLIGRLTVSLAPSQPELIHRDFVTVHSPVLSQRAGVLRC